MELLLKRNEIGRSRYDLFAKLELEPEEEVRIRKAAPEKNYVWEPDIASKYKEGRSATFKGAGLAILLGLIASVMHPILFWLVAPISWFPLRKWVFNRNRQGVTISDLMTGRTIHCKSMDELYVKEDAIRNNTTTYCGNLQRMESWGDVQSHNLNLE